MSSSKADPRRPDKIVPYHLPSKSSGETDWAGNVAMAVAMGGIMVRNKYMAVPWIAAFFGLSSWLNTRKSQREDAAGYSAGVLAFVSLFTYYLNLYFTHRRAMLAAGPVEINVDMAESQE